MSPPFYDTHSEIVLMATLQVLYQYHSDNDAHSRRIARTKCTKSCKNMRNFARIKRVLKQTNYLNQPTIRRFTDTDDDVSDAHKSGILICYSS